MTDLFGSTNWKEVNIKYYMITILAVVLFCISATCIAQEIPAISKPDLEVRGGQLIIDYDIVNDKPGDHYLVDILVSDSLGNKIDTWSLSGDIGQNVEGGNSKRIIWEYLDDNVSEEIKITVIVEVEKLTPRMKEAPTTISSSPKSYSRSGLILQSLALPGLGMTKLKEKPYWIYGVIGYGLIGNSIYFMYRSNTSYVSYEDAVNREASEAEKDLYYDQYLNEFWISIGSAAGAAAIWLTDFLLITVSSKNMNKYAHKSLQIVPGYDYRTRSPMLSMTYKF